MRSLEVWREGRQHSLARRASVGLWAELLQGTGLLFLAQASLLIGPFSGMCTHLSVCVSVCTSECPTGPCPDRVFTGRHGH